MKTSRNTAAKREIMDILQGAEHALAHAEIQQMMDGKCDRVTIYRVLDRLVGDGVVHKIVSVDGVVRYATCHTCSKTQHIHNHIHFNCTICKMLTCLEGIRPEYTLPKGYQVNDAQFILTGICPNCQS